MTKRTLLISTLIAVAFSSTSAFADNFWGISLGTGSYGGLTNLTFNGVANSGAQYVVGGYKYTCVDGVWQGPFEAASPGASYTNASYRSDAQGLFFKNDGDSAKFVVVTGASQNGAKATECGYDQRLFGPGDLKIDIGGQTYGIGMRISNLLWAQDPTTTKSYFQIHNTDNSNANIHARDIGTLGQVELNPLWARVDHDGLAANSDATYAFYINGTGTNVGSANVSFTNTGVKLCNNSVYAYEISVPWATLGISNPGAGYNMTASWRPDCGNDLITANFSAMSLAPSPIPSSVPEPGALLCLMSGIIGLGVVNRRRR